MTFAVPAAIVVTLLTGQTPVQPPPDTGCAEMATALQGLLRHDERLSDWPELGRYRAVNRVLASPAEAAARVVFMGDSITDIWQQPQFGDFFANPQYIDRGISGQTTPQMLVRFRPDVIALDPKVVVILAGTNDIAGNTGPMTDEEIEGNLASMSELAHAHGIKVVLASIMPTSAYHTRSGGTPQTTLRPMARIRALNDWIRQYAAAHGDTYLDYFTPMLDETGVMKETLTGDDLHPNAAGFVVMAPLARAAIARALGSAR